MKATMTKAAFAREQHCRVREVDAAIPKGLPVTKKGLIPIPSGRTWWRANRQTRVNSKGTSLPVKLYTKARAEKMVSDARRSGADAERAVLELAVRRGELVDLGAVRKAWFDIGRAIRDRMQAIPERVGAQLAVEADPARVRTFLASEIASALEALVGDLKYEEPQAEKEA